MVLVSLELAQYVLCSLLTFVYLRRTQHQTHRHTRIRTHIRTCTNALLSNLAACAVSSLIWALCNWTASGFCHKELNWTHKIQTQRQDTNDHERQQRTSPRELSKRLTWECYNICHIHQIWVHGTLRWLCVKVTWRSRKTVQKPLGKKSVWET